MLNGVNQYVNWVKSNECSWQSQRLVSTPRSAAIQSVHSLLRILTSPLCHVILADWAISELAIWLRP